MQGQLNGHQSTTDHPTDRWLDLAAAAAALSTTPEALRLRIKRGTLPGRKQDNRWYVCVPSSDRAPALADDQSAPTPTDQPISHRPVATDRSQPIETNQPPADDDQSPPSSDYTRDRDELIAELRSRISFLEQQMEQAAIERAELRRLIAAALSRVPQLPPASTDSPDRTMPAIQPRPWWAFWRRQDKHSPA